MNAAVVFEWPKALRAVKAAAEAGTLQARTLYPVEVKALCDLVAGASLDDSPREIAPLTTATRREEFRDPSSMTEATRSAWYFICRIGGGRVWQCSLFTDWELTYTRQANGLPALAPKNIAQALTRVMAERGPK